MSRLMFVYLTGPEKGKTRIYSQDHVTIGTSDTSDLRLVPEEGGGLPEGVIADIYDDRGEFRLFSREEAQSLPISINGDMLSGDQTASGYELRDGDSVHFGHGLSSASILFQVMPENFSTSQLARRDKNVEPVTRQPVHPLTATLFVKELTAGLWAEVPRRVKLSGLIMISLLLLVTLGGVYFFIISTHRNTTMIELLRKQGEEEQYRRSQDQELIRKQQEEIDRLRKEGEETRLFTQRIAERYSPGVCLIVGSYSFVERGTNRPLRYETSDDASDSVIDQHGNLLASVDGAGPPVQIEYTGTGFLVSEGLIATNKHVVQPWGNDTVAQIILQQGGGFKPKLDVLEAFFPSIQKPFEMAVVKASDRYDLALCRFEQGDAALPVLQLSTDDPRSIIGQPVVLLGYPTGVDGLIQRIEEGERREIQKAHNDSVQDMAEGLAARGLIRPLTTTGTISDALPGRIVHSAQTTEGGSGSPIFDREGHVIAINSAILMTSDGTQSFGGSNFGVPIKAAYEMLIAYHNTETKP